MRDLVLGLEVVTGDGRITRSGGKVVKNVAGFDLVRLQTGAWGTLGVITEVSIRLRALPELDETVAIVLDVRKPLVAHLVALRDLAVAPLAIELVDGALAERLGVGVSTMLLVRLAGNETRVSAQRLELATLGDSRVVSNNVWQTLRVVDDGSVASVRVSHLPSELSRTWAMVHGELAGAGMSGFLMRATVSRGVVRVVVPSAALAGAGTNALASMVHSLTPPGGHVVWEKLPANAWTGVPSAVGDALSAGLQRAFDRARRCNIGILGTTPS
jgi:FAD/FMN-containing dehydrogenase